MFYKKWISIVKLFTVFVILKSLVYFSPLLLSEFVSMTDYGKFEYSLNLAQTLVGIFSMGLASSYAYFVLTKNDNKKISGFHLHFFILTFLIVLIVIIYPSILSNLYFGAALISIALANQQLFSSVLKINGENKIAVTIDTGIYIILSLILITFYFNLITFSFELWFTSIFIYVVLIALFFHLKRMKGSFSMLRNDYIEIYKYGLLVVISGPLLLLVNASTRLYIEHFLTLEIVGEYSYYFRLSSLVLIFSRVIIIVLFRNFFLSNHEKLDSYFWKIMTFVFIVNICFFIFLAFVFNNKFDFIRLDNKYLLLMCFFQVNFWITTSFLEPVLQRENLVKQFILVLSISLAILLGGLALMNSYNFITLELIVWFNTLIIFLLFLGQQYILQKKQVYYKKSLTVHLVQGGIFLPTIFLIF